MNLGRKSLPCLIVDLDEDKVKQYRIVDNKVAESSRWDNGKLIRELQTMDDPFDIEDFFPEGLVKLLGDYSTTTEIQNFQKEAEENKREIHYTSTGYEQPRPVEVPYNEIEAVETDGDNENSSNSEAANGDIDSEEFEKRKSYFDDQVRNIQQEREVHNRSYKEVVCPKCGKKFLIKQY